MQGAFVVSWIKEWWLIRFPLVVLMWRTSTLLSATNFRGILSVSWMTVLCLPPLPELASLASRSALAFCSLGTCTSSNVAKAPFNISTYLKYAAIYGSFAWYSPVTCPVTNWESLFARRLWAPISLANSIPTISASYSTWLLLTLKAKRKVCSINTPLGPSKIFPVPLPYWLEDPSTESIHCDPNSISWGSPPGESSATKSA